MPRPRFSPPGGRHHAALYHAALFHAARVGREHFIDSVKWRLSDTDEDKATETAVEAARSTSPIEIVQWSLTALTGLWVSANNAGLLATG